MCFVSIQTHLQHVYTPGEVLASICVPSVSTGGREGCVAFGFSRIAGHSICLEPLSQPDPWQDQASPCTQTSNVMLISPVSPQQTPVAFYPPLPNILFKTM